MCGIFGFVGFEEPNLLERMGNALRHRGPDDVGYFADAKLRMGMRRLSIIDLLGGHQPIFNEDRSVVVVYNGEIYNYLELFNELEAKGHTFRTRCDTEVIVHAYEEYGRDCLQKFNGMFAFALYDMNEKSLFIARDRTGIKPLYYYHQNGKFIFASEIKAILESDTVTPQCNVTAIDSYLELRYVPQPDTMFQGLKVLPAAHYMVVKNGDVATSRYWDIPHPDYRYESDAYYEELLEAEFLRAVKYQMRSDVPVGAYLSGGVDSSLIVAAMRRLTDKVKTFSIGFASSADETESARQLANELDCEHHEIRFMPKHFGLLPKAIWHLERPIGDALILAYYLLAEETAQHVKVVLSGEGADELFAGYQFHKVIRWTHAFTKMVPTGVTKHLLAPALGAMPVWMLDKMFIYPAHLGEKGKEKVLDYLRKYSERSVRNNYVCLRRLFDEQERMQLYSAEFRRQAGNTLANTDDHEPRGHPDVNHLMDELLRLQFNDWLQDNLLLRQDKTTMAHSLEMRVPFLDHELVELAFRMPANLKVRLFTDKYIERLLAKKMLPKAVAERSKHPFYIPVEYFRNHGEFRELVELTLNRNTIERRGYFHYEAVKSLVDRMGTGEFIYVKQVMALVILELWHRVFIDKEKLW